tara:strand:- start:74 stop:223 length:150 start_codon:yes stop_codon:yes gene_type:complete
MIAIKIIIRKKIINLIACLRDHGFKLPSAAEYNAAKPKIDNKITINIKR